jgi:thiamine-monophosphate kinase
VLQLGLPQQVPEDFVRRFAAALLSVLQETDCRLFGGDTCRSPQIMLGLTVWGGTARVITRAGGQAGDVLYVTGPIGLARMGYLLLERGLGQGDLPEEGLEARALLRFRRGLARPDWARRAALDPNVHAAIDLSDGLRSDAARLASASGLVLAVDLELLPLPTGLPLSTREALDSGEEYEILFLGSPGLAAQYGAVAIGRALDTSSIGRPALIFREHGLTVDPPSTAYEHFSR